MKEADYDVTSGEDNEVTFYKNHGADQPNRLTLRTGHEITIHVECPSDDYRTNAYSGITVYLVDKKEKDKDIANEEADIEYEIEDHFCGDSGNQEECEFTTEIPEDIDEGKHKLVIEAGTDELDTYLISKVTIKE